MSSYKIIQVICDHFSPSLVAPNVPVWDVHSIKTLICSTAGDTLLSHLRVGKTTMSSPVLEKWWEKQRKHLVVARLCTTHVDCLTLPVYWILLDFVWFECFSRSCVKGYLMFHVWNSSPYESTSQLPSPHVPIDSTNWRVQPEGNEGNCRSCQLAASFRTDFFSVFQPWQHTMVSCIASVSVPTYTSSASSANRFWMQVFLHLQL